MENKSATARAHLQRLYQRQRLLQIGVFSLVTLMIWVGFGLLRSQQRTRISPELRKLAEPLTPTIDLQVLDEIETERAYSEAELANFPIYKVLVSEETGEQTVVTIDVTEADLAGPTGTSELGISIAEPITESETEPDQEFSPEPEPTEEELLLEEF